MIHASEFLDAQVEPAERRANHGHFAFLRHVGGHLPHMGNEPLQFLGLKVQDLDQFVHDSSEFFDIHAEPLIPKERSAFAGRHVYRPAWNGPIYNSHLFNGPPPSPQEFLQVSAAQAE
jgi:hypothetical protein